MNQIITYFFLIIRIISNPAANAFQKKLSYSIPSSIINFYTYLILSIFCIPFFNKYVQISTYEANFWFYVLIAGLLCALGTLYLIKAINIGELSVIGPINSYKSVIGLISAFLFLREVPSIIGIAGVILIVAGSYFIFENEKEGFSFSLLKRKDIQYRFFALILTGTEAAILKRIIIMSSVETCFIFWCLSGLLWSFFIIFILKRKIKLPEKELIKYLFLIAVCLGLMQYSTNYVFERMNVGFALALFQLSSVITVFLGYKFFKEENIIKKLTGTAIMLSGSVLIILCG